MELVIGTFTFERETKNTFVYVRENGNGRKESQYVPKAVLDDVRPEEVTVVVRFA